MWRSGTEPTSRACQPNDGGHDSNHVGARAAIRWLPASAGYHRPKALQVTIPTVTWFDVEVRADDDYPAGERNDQVAVVTGWLVARQVCVHGRRWAAGDMA
jgi:hypothetical protein